MLEGNGIELGGIVLGWPDGGITDAVMDIPSHRFADPVFYRHEGREGLGTRDA